MKKGFANFLVLHTSLWTFVHHQLHTNQFIGRKRRGRKDHHVGNTQGVGDLSARDAKEFDAAVLAKEKKVTLGVLVCYV